MDKKPEPASTDDLTGGKPSPGSAGLRRGDTIGRYVILAELGEDGSGGVYKAFDPDMDRQIALKLLRIQVSQDQEYQLEEARDRLLRGAQALAKLSHPNVVSAYDVGTISDYVFVAMELVEGKTLREWIEDLSPSQSEAIAALQTAGHGIAAAHEAGLIHCDIKPDNVIVGNDGRVQVLGFGLARLASRDKKRAQDRQTQSQELGPLTEEIVREFSVQQHLRDPATPIEAIGGEPGYMSPEQYFGQEMDEKSDQFAFCATLYFALYRKPAFSGASLAERTAKILHGQVDEPPLHPRVPTHLRRAMMRGLSADPQDRFGAIEDLLSEMARNPHPVRRRLLWVTGMALLAAFAVAGWGWNENARQEQCLGSAEAIQTVWNPTRKADLSQAILASGGEQASFTQTKLIQILDRFADSWRQRATESCAATYVHGEQSLRLHQRRMACLHRRQIRAAAFIEVLLEIMSRQVLDHCVEAALDLAAADSCAKTESLLASEIDAEPEASHHKLMAGLARAEALKNLGASHRALAAVENVLADLRQIDSSSLQTESQLLAAQLYGLTGKADRAASFLDEAVLAAAEDHQDRLVARSWVAMMKNLVQRNLDQEALLIRPTTSLAIVRAGEDPSLHATVHKIWAGILLRANKAQEAGAHLQKTLGFQEQAGNKNHPRLARALAALGDVFESQQRFDAARPLYQRAFAIAEQVLGPLHPITTQVQSKLATSLIRKNL